MENVNIRVMEQNRAQVNSFGRVFGTGVFTPKKEGVITDFNARKQNMSQFDLFVTRNINRYKLGLINITGVNYAKDAEGEDCVIISGIDASGNDVKIPCNIANSTFTKEPTSETLREALESGKPVFFKNARALKGQINDLNNKELDRVTKLIAELEGMRDNLKATIKSNDEKVDEYYDQLDKKGGDVSIHMHAELEG